MGFLDRPIRQTWLEIILRALAWALIFLLAGTVGDYVADRMGMQRDLLYLNDIVSAVFIALLIVVYEHRRRKRIEARLNVIREMNHHVRNALQLIALSPHAQEKDEQLALMQQAASRIEWALQEVLPNFEPPAAQEGPFIDARWKRPIR